jgi:NADH:ubiquinone oxidoreductase subunit 5 (subunit L)/multisubunit Na+/H+ antiporter MnhA subunit
MEGEGSVGYMASMFHLFTHAMFKALLFLCSGAIIVIIGSNFKEYMGGLHKYMPITNICFLIGCIAISGFWPLAGFFSKDEIVDACFHFSPFMGWFMTLGIGMTAFYMFRLYYVIFWGQATTRLIPSTAVVRPRFPSSCGVRWCSWQSLFLRGWLDSFRSLRISQWHERGYSVCRASTSA